MSPLCASYLLQYSLLPYILDSYSSSTSQCNNLSVRYKIHTISVQQHYNNTITRDRIGYRDEAEGIDTGRTITFVCRFRVCHTSVGTAGAERGRSSVYASRPLPLHSLVPSFFGAARGSVASERRKRSAGTTRRRKMLPPQNLAPHVALRVGVAALPLPYTLPPIVRVPVPVHTLGVPRFPPRMRQSKREGERERGQRRGRGVAGSRRRRCG